MLYAIEQGFDGVFIAADGEECAYLPDCVGARLAPGHRAQTLLRAQGYEPRRVRMGAICSVCADPFVNYMREFSKALAELAPSQERALST